MSYTGKFRVGQKVHMTERAIVQGLDGRRKLSGQSGRHGTVTGLNAPFGVKVKRGGRKRDSWWHVDFWTPCQSRAGCERVDPK